MVFKGNKGIRATRVRHVHLAPHGAPVHAEDGLHLSVPGEGRKGAEPGSREEMAGNGLPRHKEGGRRKRFGDILGGRIVGSDLRNKGARLFPGRGLACPCRGLTPHRSLKWPAWEGGLAFGGHQARSSSEVRFTGLTENCHTTNQSQESTCLTMLCNECCVGYWKAGALCLGRLADFGRGISRRIVPKRNPMSTRSDTRILFILPSCYCNGQNKGSMM